MKKVLILNSSKKFNFLKSKNRISMKIVSYNKNFINFFIFKFRSENRLFRVFKLPIKKSLFTILRSPFVNKKSRIQVGFKVYKWKIIWDYYDFFKKYPIFKNFIERFLLNRVKKNLTSKYSVSCKVYRNSFSF